MDCLTIIRRNITRNFRNHLSLISTITLGLTVAISRLWTSFGNLLLFYLPHVLNTMPILITRFTCNYSWGWTSSNNLWFITRLYLFNRYAINKRCRLKSISLWLGLDIFSWLINNISCILWHRSAVITCFNCVRRKYFWLVT